MEAKLVPVMGFEGPEEISLPVDKMVIIGRGDTAQVRLRQSKVSRHHCQLTYENGFYSIQDLDSKNGTWVNNRRVHKAILFHHDRIAVGSAEFRFVLEGEPSDAASQAIADPSTDVVFETNIREKQGPDATSSLLLSLPRSEAGEDQEDIERNLSVICKVISSVNAEHQLDRLLEIIMDSAMQVSGADRGYLIAAKKLNGALMPLVSRNREGLPAYARETFSRSIVSECYENSYSILRADPAHDIDASESIITQKIQSIMCAPMTDKEGPVGVLYVDTLLGSRKFSKRDLQVLTAVGNQAGIAIRRAQLTKQVETLFRDSIRTLINLVEVKDEYTYGHSERVTSVAVHIAEVCGLDQNDLRDVELSGLLHDVGKLAVSQDILKKPGKLTPEEYEAVKKHPITGAAVLSNVENAEKIADAIRHHHEHWDGTGYPDSLTGERIALVARVLAMADAYDAMASDRPYRDALTQEHIITEFKQCSGTQFDPHLTRRFTDALETDAILQARIQNVYTKKEPEQELEGSSVLSP